MKGTDVVRGLNLEYDDTKSDLVNLYNFAVVLAEATSETLTASGYVQFMFVMIAEYVAAYAAL